MANVLLPIEERNLTPDEIELIDARKRRGQACLVICYLCIIVGTLMTIWSGQDLTYSPGWIHPMFYWNAILGIGAVIFGIAGVRMRGENNEFFSY